MTELRRANQFLEHGEYNGNMYGTSIDSVRSVVEQHKMCVLDIQPAVSAYNIRYTVTLVQWTIPATD